MIATLPVRPRLATERRGRSMLAVASGKGGVGKTWFSITLAHALARRGQRPLLFDGDLGLANVDIQLGLMPSVDLAAVLAGRMTLDRAVCHYDAGCFDVLAGRSGSGRLATVQESRINALVDDLITLSGAYDRVILDLGAGVERTVRQLSRAASTCIVVTTNEPTALTDGYAFIKVLHKDRPDADIRIVVNAAASRSEGERTYATLLKACQSFLKMSPPLLGVIRRDPKVADAIRSQSSLLTRFPGCNAAEDVEAIANRLVSAPVERA